MIKNILMGLGGIYITLFLLMIALVLFSMLRYKFKNRLKKGNNDQANAKLINEHNNVNNELVEPKKIDVEEKKEEKKYETGEYVASKFSDLQSNIKKHIDESNNISLLVIGNMIGLDANEIIGEDSSFELKFIDCSKELVKFDRFKIITNARITAGDYAYSNTDLLDIYHHILCVIYIEKFNNFLVYFKEYFDFIEQNKEILTSKKRVYLIEDEFGDIDGSKWIDYLQRFAERRKLNRESDHPDDMEAVNNYIKLLNLDNFEGKAISSLLALWEHFEKKENKYASVYTGVDFEHYLKNIIEEQLDSVYVETTPASGDHGADLIVRYKGIAVAIQAKYYTGSVGNAAVQEIHSGMGFYDADYGMVVTQSKYTEHAKSLAMKLNIHLEDVETFITKIKNLSN